MKYKFISGVDEVGRGPLAGPVCAAAVILKPEFKNTFGITDSKKLSEQKREELYDIIIDNSLAWAVERIENEVIDEINILQATQRAMHNAIKSLKIKPDELKIDGNYFIDMGIPYETIVKGDLKELVISCASILAKVTRDRWMIEVADKLYPQYLFAKNKGYGTAEHIEAIKKYGICPLHRESFLQNILYPQIEMF
jgi:ribonuclease HII